VGKSKSYAGVGRVIPLNDTVLAALQMHAAWYIRRFGECKPEWFVFPAGKSQPNDPTRPITTLRTAWTKMRDKAKVVGRWHDNRRTPVTELAESGAGDKAIVSTAGHVSRAMLSRYSHVRMEAKRRALDQVASRQSLADEKRMADFQMQRQASAVSEASDSALTFPFSGPTGHCSHSPILKLKNSELAFLFREHRLRFDFAIFHNMGSHCLTTRAFAIGP
jgi:hypothetical protein